MISSIVSWVKTCDRVKEFDTRLVLSQLDFAGEIAVMPAKLVPDSDPGAGIQEDSALASGYSSWIPGLALLARNDVPPA